MPVSPYKGNIYDIPFGQSGMVAHENRWLSQRTELVRAENVTFENDVLQKDPAVTVYDPQGIDAFSQTCNATATVGGNWQAALEVTGTVQGSVAPVLIKTAAAVTQFSPWTNTVTATAAVGTYVIVSLYAIGLVTPTIADSRGNPYTLVLNGPAGSGSAPSDPTVGIYHWQGVMLNPLVNGVDTITISWSGGSANPQLVATAYIANGIVYDTATATAAGTTCLVPGASAPMVALRSYVYPLLTVCSLFLDQDTATSTVSAGIFTKIGTANSAGRGQLVQAYKVSGIPIAITAQVDWNSQAATGNVAGTVTVQQGSTTVTGAGTSFLSAYRVNDEILVNNEVQVVAAIASNTSLTTYSPWSQATASGQTASRRAGPVIVTAAFQADALGAGGGAIYKESNGGFTPGAGILAGTTLFSDTVFSRVGKFVVAGKESAAATRKLFYFDGIHRPQYLPDDAAAMTYIAGPTADWGGLVDASKNPVNGILHLNALFAWGNLSDPHRIYRSRTADHTQFVNSAPADDAGQYPIASSIGERLWCGEEYQGVLFLWKYPRGIFYFDDTDPNYLNWSYHIRSEALGCAPSPYATLPIDDDIVFCAADGHFHLLSHLSDLGGTRSSDITRTLGLHRWTRENVDIPSLKQMSSTYNSYTKTAYFGVRSRATSGPHNDLLLKFDFALVPRGGPIRFSYSTAYLPNALCTRRSASQGSPQSGTPLLFIGEIVTSMIQVLDDGTVGTKLTHGFRNDPIRGARYVSTSYAINGSTARLDFSDVDPMNRQRRKNFDLVEFVFGESAISDLSGQTLTAQFYVDGLLMQTMKNIGMTTNTRIQKPLRIGDGYELQIVLSTQSVASAAAASPVLVPDIVGLGIQVYWRPGGQDHSRPT